MLARARERAEAAAPGQHVVCLGLRALRDGQQVGDRARVGPAREGANGRVPDVGILVPDGGAHGVQSLRSADPPEDAQQRSAFGPQKAALLRQQVVRARSQAAKPVGRVEPITQSPAPRDTITIFPNPEGSLLSTGRNVVMIRFAR